jgi:hypothetical protein
MLGLTPLRAAKLFGALVAGLLVWLWVSDRDCIVVANAAPLRAGPPPAVIRGELCAGSGPCEPALLLAGAFRMGAAEKILFDLADLKQYPDGRTANWLCLLSAGGNVGVAEEVARGLRFLGLRSCVVPITEASILQLPGVPRPASDTECASACVILFLAAKDRLLHPQAAIGVHQGKIAGGASCTFYNVRGIFDDLAAALRRISNGSPIGLEARVFWYGTLTPHEAIYRIQGDPPISSILGEQQAATWRPLEVATKP